MLIKTTLMKNPVAEYFILNPLMLGISLFILYLIISFSYQFWFKAIQLNSRLKKIIKALKDVKKSETRGMANFTNIFNEVIGSDEILKHLWSQYQETLHAQNNTTNDLGQEQVSQYRATNMAEVFFNENSIIESPLKTEFYKHLPGILTGLGIIGTFVGLIKGLTTFASHGPSDPSIAQKNLGDLIECVGHAFYVSATAITLAMICTWIEKLMLSKLYGKVGEICHLLDSFFEAGAGEEYLARLVKASEASLTQSLQIKDSLVNDLKKFLVEQSNKEVEAAARQSKEMTGTLSQAIANSIQAPMAQISQAVHSTGENQGEAVNRLLTDVLLNFTTQMQGMFGGQMNGLNSALQESVRAMESIVSRFDDLAGSLQGAGKNTADTMANKMQDVIKDTEKRQEFMMAQLLECIREIRDLVSNSQSENDKKTQEVLKNLGEKVSETVNTLQTQVNSAARIQENRETQIVARSQGAIKDSSDLVEKLSQEVSSATLAMKSSIAKLTEITQTSIQKLDSGAETLYMAAKEFSKAGTSVSGTLQAAAQATGKIETASGNLVSASRGVQGIFEDYQKTRDVFALMVNELKTTITNSKREASLTSDLVSRLEGGAEKLGLAEKAAEEYLKGVTAVIVQVHKDFSDNLSRTLTEGNGKFQTEVAAAASYLSGAIQNLGDTLDSVLVKINK